MNRTEPYTCIEEVICDVLNASFSNLKSSKNLITKVELDEKGEEKKTVKIEDKYTFDIRLIGAGSGRGNDYNLEKVLLSDKQYEFLLDYLKSKETPQPNGDDDNG